MNTRIEKRFWQDDEVMECAPDVKLALLWALTHETVDICGAFRVSLKRFEYETGLPRARFEELLVTFKRSLVRVGEHVWIRNFIRLQFGPQEGLGRNNMRHPITRAYQALPEDLQKVILSEYPELKPLVRAMGGLPKVLQAVGVMGQMNSSGSAFPNQSMVYIEPSDDSPPQALYEPSPSPTLGQERRGEENKGEESTLEGGAGETSVVVGERVSDGRRSATSLPRLETRLPGSVEDVIAAGSKMVPVVSEERSRAFWSHFEGTAKEGPNGERFWTTAGGAVITNWRVKLAGFEGRQTVSGGKGGAGSPVADRIALEQGLKAKRGLLGRLEEKGSELSGEDRKFRARLRAEVEDLERKLAGGGM